MRAIATHENWIATGGDDGAIKVWNAAAILASKDTEQSSTIINKVRVPMVVQ